MNPIDSALVPADGPGDAMATQVLEAIDQGFAIFDAEDRLIVANRVYRETFPAVAESIAPGVAFETLIRLAAERGQNVEALSDPESWVQTRLAIHRAASGVYEHKFSDGRWIQVRERRTPLGHTIGTYTDVTSLMRRTEEAAHHLAVLEGVMHSIPQGVIVYSPQRRVQMRNRQATQLLGCSVDHGDALEALRSSLGPDPIDAIVRWFSAGEGRELAPMEFSPRPGVLALARANFMTTGGFVLTVGDVTELREASRMAHQAQKLAALGELAGGVAHQFNNLLTSIGGFARMALRSPDDADSVKECLEEVIGATQQAADMTRQMLSFSRKENFEERVVVAAGLVKSLVRMVRPLLPETVQLTIDIDDETSCVKVEATQMSQALMNLILNSRDALPQGGRIHLRVCPGRAPDASDAHPWIVFSVTDNGTGIAEQDLSRIFDPFFTTKAPGQGTGLGLSVVHGIVRRAGGQVTVRSMKGAGTTFSLHLPVAGGQPDAEPAPDAAAPSGEGRTVMVLEDEPAVRRLVVKTLQAQGYRVVVAGDPAAAMRAFSRRGPTPDLLLTDVVLPGRSGPEVATELLQSHPSLKVVFMSGYVSPEIQDLGLIGEHAQVISKPFAPEALCRVIGSVLRSEPHAREEAAT